MADQAALRYDELEVGRVFGPFSYAICADWAQRYAEVVGAEPAVYPQALQTGHDSPPLAPPLLLDILAPLKALLLPFPEGVVHAREELELHAPVRVGDLVAIWLTVTDRYLKNDKRFVVFEQRAENERGHLLAMARKTLVWPR